MTLVTMQTCNKKHLALNGNFSDLDLTLMQLNVIIFIRVIFSLQKYKYFVYVVCYFTQLKGCLLICIVRTALIGLFRQVHDGHEKCNVRFSFSKRMWRSPAIIQVPISCLPKHRQLLCHRLEGALWLCQCGGIQQR